MWFQRKTQVSTSPESLSNSCNLDLALNLLPVLSLKLLLPLDYKTSGPHRVFFFKSTKYRKVGYSQPYPQPHITYPQNLRMEGKTVHKKDNRQLADT